MHPSDRVTINSKQHAVQKTSDEIVPDGEFVRVPLTMADAAAIQGTAIISDAAAAYDGMCREMSEAWKGQSPVNDNRPKTASPRFARDGTPMASLSDQARAYEEMCIRDANAWRS